MNFPPKSALFAMWMAAVGLGATTTQAVSAELEEAFGWLDSAGLPSATGLQPVEVWTGRFCEVGGKKIPVTFPAFLVSQQDHSIQVQTLWGERMTFGKQGGTANPHRARVKLRTLDWFVQIHSEGLSFCARFALFDELLPSDLIQWLMLARHCRDFQAEGLLKRADAEIEKRLEQGARHSNETMEPKQRLAEAAAEYLLQSKMRSFGQPAKSWLDLRQEVEGIVKAVPNTSASAKARLLADRIAEVIEEEQLRPLLSHAEILKLPVEQQAAEQVRRLRMQTLLSGSKIREGDHVSDELAKLGTAAVPALIKAVDDLRPTRCVRFVRRTREWHLSSIGDQALVVLNRIASKRFAGHHESGPFVSASEKPSEARLEAEAWWAGYQANPRR